MASWTGSLTVRLVRTGERARFEELLRAHHWLGLRLFGSVIRHVAVLDGSWVALAGYGSAVLRCTARDRLIGWSDAMRVGRLPMLAGNQRFCVLPGARPHLASAVLARSLARLPGDYLAVHNQIVLAVETFTDPSRHHGTCYAAAGFTCAGTTSGYARGAGGAGYRFHGQVKRCWLRQVHPAGLAALGAPVTSVLFDPPPPAVWLDLSGDQIVSLRGHLAAVLTDPRLPRGIRHDYAATTAIAAASMLTGHPRAAAIAAHASTFGQDTLKLFGVRRSERTGGYIAPSESSIRRMLRSLPPGALTGAITCWLAGQAAAGSIEARHARRLTAALPGTPVAVR